MPSIFVDIPVEGDWPSPDDLSARNAVTDELDAQGFGEFQGAGGGMGSMDFSYNVAATETAKATVESLLSKYLPGREFTISVSEG